MASDKQPTTADKPEQPQPTAQKSAAALEEDDEFEDFPVEGAFHSLTSVFYSLASCHITSSSYGLHVGWSPDLPLPCPLLSLHLDGL